MSEKKFLKVFESVKIQRYSFFCLVFVKSKIFLKVKQLHSETGKLQEEINKCKRLFEVANVFVEFLNNYFVVPTISHNQDCLSSSF